MTLSNRYFRGTGVAALLSALVLSGCSTTSGSTRLDDTGNRIAVANGYQADDAEPANSAFYIQALKGGLTPRLPGIKLDTSNRTRALEAEYKALESAPSGQAVIWEGSDGLKGEVIAAVPYQVGSQNCRQYSHKVSVNDGPPALARGAACRNPNGSWTPLS